MLDENEEGHPMPEELIQYRSAILQSGTIRTPMVTGDCYDLSVGMPLPPGQYETHVKEPRVFFWGDWDSDPTTWPTWVFTDGSAIPSSIPELRRCGSA
eukprot:8197139-Pyramimonas_sp.AAC.1